MKRALAILVPVMLALIAISVVTGMSRLGLGTLALLLASLAAGFDAERRGARLPLLTPLAMGLLGMTLLVLPGTAGPILPVATKALLGARADDPALALAVALGGLSLGLTAVAAIGADLGRLAARLVRRLRG